MEAIVRVILESNVFNRNVSATVLSINPAQSDPEAQTPVSVQNYRVACAISPFMVIEEEALPKYTIRTDSLYVPGIICIVWPGDALQSAFSSVFKGTSLLVPALLSEPEAET